MSIDPFGDDEPLGADSLDPSAEAPGSTKGGKQARPESGATERAEPQAATPAPHGVLLIGPGGTGKTLLLSALQDACSIHAEPEIRFNPMNLAGLIQDRRRKVFKRQGLQATLAPREYRFSTTLQYNGTGQELGGITYECFDGPGGALFPEEVDAEGGQSEDMKAYRSELVSKGRSAQSLVILVNPVTERIERKISNNLPELIQDMLVPTEIPAPLSLSEPQSWWERTLGRTPPAPPPTRPPSIAYRFPFDRVLIMLNRFDQPCVEWKKRFVASRSEDQSLSPLEIAYWYSNPVETALNVFGRAFLHQLLAQLKPSGQLAVGVCSAGGYLKLPVGDPYLNEVGEPNAMHSISPGEMIDKVELFGLRELLLYAGYGITTPNVVESITRNTLNQFS